MASRSSSSTTPRSPASLYLAGPWLDGLLIGGASIAVYAAFRLLRAPGGESVDAFSIFSLAWLINGAHFSATSWRLYSRWENVRRYPVTAAIVPLLMAAAVAFCLRRPEATLPYFVKLYLLWSAYHYSGQTCGVTRLYARRAGVSLSAWERKALSGFVFGTFVAATARLEARLGWQPMMGVAMPSLGLPGFLAPASLAVAWICGLVFLAGAARRAWTRREPLPWIAFVPAAAQYVWFVQGTGPRAGAFFALVPLFHGLQYLLVAWHARRRESELGTAGWLAVNAAGHFVLFAGLPALAALAFGCPYAAALPAVSAAVQIHHFFVDGVIWKLREPAVASALLAAPEAA